MTNPTSDALAFKELVVRMVGSTDNEVRSNAEKQYTEIPLQMKAQYLLQIYMDSGSTTEVRLNLFVITIKF
jgi:hypothetical protein